MTLLQFFFIISWIIILILSIDISRKQKFNALHFLVFIWVWWGLLIFTLFPNILSNIWNVFWVARWADVLVYSSIIFLLYFVLLLLTKHVDNKDSITGLIREIAIDNSKKIKTKKEMIFVIPAYNEWKQVYNTVKNILDTLDVDIVVINDWSKDKTRFYLDELSDNIVVLNHLKNRWQWAALETGFEYIRRYSENKYIVTFDADDQHDLADLEEFKKYLNEDVDILLWSRFLGKSETNIPIIRKIILKLWILFTFFVSHINLTDTHNWYRLIKRTVIDKIKITIDGMWHASEILDIIASDKIKYKEVPVNIRYTDYSLEKWQSSGNALNIALRMIWSKFFR